MNALAALAQYGQVKNDAQTMYASPHQLVLMLFDGAVEAMSMTMGAIQHKNIELRGKQSTRAISIINGLRDCLDMETGGELADNLYSLYQYMAQELFRAAFKNDVETIENVQAMLKDIRGSWEKIPLDMHYMQKAN
ncbi:MAG: flagellar export chaperone FliS [Oceanospirillaceae bacterium]|jgi:flagellar protein FliS|nr:flagellar export chaperone FliS [Oceanospirillaceae bacterium]MBT4441763.1 flagellar export chaperone FliS [Oceanospirillaceae bacterium]